MAFSHMKVRPAITNLGRFWPVVILLFVAVVYFAQLELSISKKLSPNEAAARKQATQYAPSPKALPYPVVLAMVHYATSNITPQQTIEEIMVTANILNRRGPCNFLVFGLGFDSPLWHALNHGGLTVFLEEDPSWIAQMAQAHPYLESYHVNYTTILSDAENLLAYARKEKEICSADMELRQSSCKLALRNLPAQVYSRQWDVIMIDAPRGYFPEAPGRMAAIFSAAVMAKRGKKQESTDILIHDTERPVEKSFSAEFLCSRNLIEAVGKLWHFQVFAEGERRSKEFCK